MLLEAQTYGASTGHRSDRRAIVVNNTSDFCHQCAGSIQTNQKRQFLTGQTPENARQREAVYALTPDLELLRQWPVTG